MSRHRKLSHVCIVALFTGASLELMNCAEGEKNHGGGGSGATDACAGGSTTGGTGGTSGSGGTIGGTGGTDGGYMFPAGETVTACPMTNVIDPSSLGFPECTSCSDAYCVPTSTLSSITGTSDSGANVADMLADCADGMSKCVPASYVATLGNFQMKTCRAFGGAAEGRCVNECIPQVANQVGLTQDVCGANELCAPCYMPTDGSPTGACGLGCDPGPTEAPYLFDTCCSGGGVCVSPDLVPADFQSSLSADTCTGGDLCAPSKFVDPSYKPPTCTSVAGAEGRCISSCVGAVQSLADLLPTAGCDTGEVCAPCYDPRTGVATGACTINGDMPTQDSVVFTACCDTAGLCIPKSTVDSLYEGVSGNLSSTGCGADGGGGSDPLLCVPKEPALGEPWPSCNFIPNPGGTNPPGPGICINTCTVPYASLFQHSDCADGYNCLPCFDPNGNQAIPGLACDPSLRPDGGTSDASAP